LGLELQSGVDQILTGSTLPVELLNICRGHKPNRPVVREHHL
jgi:hypothetical protein